jgi:hypothetical protein
LVLPISEWTFWEKESRISGAIDCSNGFVNLFYLFVTEYNVQYLKPTTLFGHFKLLGYNFFRKIRSK